jgi:putative membrane protein
MEKERGINLLTRILLSTIGVLVADGLIEGVVINNILTGLVAAIVLSFLNQIIRPIFTLLALPITFLTLGVFQLFINASMVLIASFLVKGFEVNGFMPAILFIVVLWLFNWFLNITLGKSNSQL